jgi:hypothetical protein
MPFKLPLHFADRVNTLDSEIRLIRGSLNETERSKYARQALLLSCDLLQSLTSAEGFVEEIHTITRNHKRLVTLRRHVYEDERFESFLDLENQLFRLIGLNENVRDRLLFGLSVLQGESDKMPRHFSPHKAIENLCRDVCLESQILIENERSREGHAEHLRRYVGIAKRTTATFGVVVVAGNLVAPHVLPILGDLLKEQSVALGTLLVG